MPAFEIATLFLTPAAIMFAAVVAPRLHGIPGLDGRAERRHLLSTAMESAGPFGQTASRANDSYLLRHRNKGD